MVLGMRGIVTPDKTWAGPDCVQTERFLKKPGTWAGRVRFLKRGC